MSAKNTMAFSPRRKASPVARFVGVDADKNWQRASSPGAPRKTGESPCGSPAFSGAASHGQASAVPGAPPDPRRPANRKGKAGEKESNASLPLPSRSVSTDTRLEGWSIIGKITPFVHAVGRVSDGRGSAILVALPERSDEERAVVHHNAQSLRLQRRSRLRGRSTQSGSVASTQPPQGFAHSNARGQLSSQATEVGRGNSPCTPGTSVAWDAMRDGDESGSEAFQRGGATRCEQNGETFSSTSSCAPLAVILTTSSVMRSREDAAGLTVTFMEQPVAGTAAQLGRTPKPFTVAVRSDGGFVCSVAPEKQQDTRGTESLDSSLHATSPRSRQKPRDQWHTSPWKSNASVSGADNCDGRGGNRHDEVLDWGQSDCPSRMNFAERRGSLPGSTGDGDDGKGDEWTGYQSRSDSANHGSCDWDRDGEEGRAQEIGYALTYCEVEEREESVYASAGVRTARGGLSATSLQSSGTPSALANCPTSDGTSDIHHYSSTAAVSMLNLGPKQQKIDTVLSLKPLPLPLLLSAVRPVVVGDTHLMVTHVNGLERHYIVQHVSTVHQDFCEYKGGPVLAGDFSSGGPVFNMNGDFVGLQHRVGDQSICMFTSSIVKHLFVGNKLGMCRPPIANQPQPEDSTFVTTVEDVPDEVFNQPFHYTQQSSVTDVGVEGERLINFDDLERIRQHRARPIPMTERKPLFSEVYKEFYTDFGSLTHMLSAFSYCPAITAMALETMVSAEHRDDLQSVASAGGIGMVLGALDSHPDKESLVATSLSALSRMCLHAHNLAAFVLLDGVATVLEIMKEYPHSPQIVQRGAYCLAHATQREAPSAQQTVDGLLRCSFVELATAALRAHGRTQDHMCRWLCVALANMVEVKPRAVTLYVREELPVVLLDLVDHFSQDQSTLAPLLALLGNMLQPLRDELPETVVSIDEQRQLQELKPFVCTSPLSVSAYFMYIALASQPAEELMPAEVENEQEGFTSDGCCSCPNCLGCLAKRDTHNDQAEARRDVAAPEEALISVVQAAGTAEAGMPPCHCSLAIPRTVLNRVLMAMLDRKSRERRNNTSVDLLTVGLDLLLSLDSWGLFPVHYTQNHLSATSLHDHGVSSPVPLLMVRSTSQECDEDFSLRSAAPMRRTVAGASIPYGFASSTVQSVLDRIRANYFASPELITRIDQLACSTEQPM